MRALLFTFILIITFSSCSTIEDNTPALQGVRDTVLFRTSDSRVFLNTDDGILIQGERGAEALNFLISDQGQTQIALGGENNPNIATYTDVNGNIFTTSSSGGSGTLNYILNGDNTVSGDFNFTAFSPSISKPVVFSKGVAFRVPVLTPITIESIPEVEVFQDNFTALVNTIPYNAIVINHVISGNIITIIGRTSTTSVAISFPTNSAPGPYLLGSNPDFSAAYTTPAGISTAITGDLIIISNDEVNNVIIGEFSFTTAEGFIITEGTFTINY